MTHPRLTVRARLTLIYAGLFAVCGAIVVAVSYTLVAQLGVQGQGQGQGPSASDLATFAARCRSAQTGAHPDNALVAKCSAALQQLGAKHQRVATLSHLLEYSLITLGVVIALAAILGWIFAGRALRPVHRITSAARAASEHNLSERVALRGPRDELRELAETFDEMLDRLQTAFEGQKHFIANASHELRTPLAVMRTTVDVVAGDPDSTPDDLRSMAADIRAAVDHAEHLLGALLILARNERGLTVHEEIDLATAAEDVLDTAVPSDRRVHATLEPAVISGDPVLAEHLIANLVDNAIRYNTAAGDIWISTHTKLGSSRLTVANTGQVVNLVDVDRIFQPFQRLSDRTSHDGCGLGLAIVASIAAIHGGSVTARPRNDGGLIVTVTIPSTRMPARGTDIQPTDYEVSPSQADVVAEGVSLAGPRAVPLPLGDGREQNRRPEGRSEVIPRSAYRRLGRHLSRALPWSGSTERALRLAAPGAGRRRAHNDAGPTARATAPSAPNRRYAPPMVRKGVAERAAPAATRAVRNVML